MGHVTTPDEADNRVNDAGIYDTLTALGLVEISTWLREAARAVPYITDGGGSGGVDDIVNEVHIINTWYESSRE